MNVLWLQSGGCGGCSMSLLCADTTDFQGHLRDAGIVRSVKGHGGGWSLARDLRDITIADVYDALGISPFHIGEREAEPTCLLERAVNHALRDALAEAEALLHEKMAAMTVAELAAIALRGHRRAHQKNQKNQKKARAHDHV